jgi:hypothetical protein
MDASVSEIVVKNANSTTDKFLVEVFSGLTSAQ